MMTNPNAQPSIDCAAAQDNWAFQSQLACLGLMALQLQHIIEICDKSELSVSCRHLEAARVLTRLNQDKRKRRERFLGELARLLPIFRRRVLGSPMI